jgi:hypothetical protein
MPTNLDNPSSVNELYERTKPSFEFTTFTSVPTDSE